MHHIMFDIDGTLIQSYDFDSECFVSSVEEVLGISIDDKWSNYQHVTDSGILNEVIESLNLTEQSDAIHKKVKKLFVNKIEVLLSKYSVKEVSGAAAFLEYLINRKDVTISIATGGWYESAILKLKSAGIEIKDISIASSNDHYIRTEIMKIAKNRSFSGDCNLITYIGDGIWDKEACDKLGYNFILVGDSISHHQKIDDFVSVEKVMELFD